MIHFIKYLRVEMEEPLHSDMGTKTWVYPIIKIFLNQDLTKYKASSIKEKRARHLVQEDKYVFYKYSKWH